MLAAFTFNPSFVLWVTLGSFVLGLALGYLGRPTREAIMEDHVSDECLNHILRMDSRKGYL